MLKSTATPIRVCFPGPYNDLSFYGLLAQLAEQLTLNQRVLGSNPRWVTGKRPMNDGRFLLQSMRGAW